MPEMTRRRLLGSALGATAGGALASFLPPGVRRAMAAGPRRGSLRDVKHVVVITQENRSFDHYFGTMAGVRGFDDPGAITLPTGRPVFYQPDPLNPDGYLLPFHLDTRTTSAQAIPSTSHAWSVQHAAWHGGAMDNWVPAHRAADGNDKGPYTMGYYEWQDIPFPFALAHAFTVCDAYHCALMGPTWPNRLYLMSGTIDPEGTGGGPITGNVIPEPYRWLSYPEQLEQAGVSWRVYQQEDDYGCNPLEFFAAYQDARPGSARYERGLTIAPAGAFERDAARGDLPTVSWVIPTSEQSEHPAYLPAAGDDFVASKLEAIAADPDLWASTVVIINYDENDGLFDHVPPPTPPAGTPGEFVDGMPIGAGFRVPCIVVSPWSQGGLVCTEPFDHTSVLRFLEQVTGVRAANITNWRRSTFGDLTSALGFHPVRRFPPLPPTKPRFWLAERQAATLPPAPFPGADQTPPHQRHTPQHTGKEPDTTKQQAGSALPPTAGRLDEVTGSARGDYPDRGSGTSFPGILLRAADRRRHATATGGELLYTACFDVGTVAILDPVTGALVGAVTGMTNPYGIAAVPGAGGPGTGKLYVTESGDNSVAIIDRATSTITGRIVVGTYPHGVTVSPDGSRAYVADTGPDTGRGGSRTVSVIDTATDTRVAAFRVGDAPKAIAASPDGTRLYVTCTTGLYVLSAAGDRVGHAHTGLDHGQGLVISPDGASCYVARPTTNAVTVLDTADDRPAATIGVGRMPWDVTFGPDGRTAYATNADDDTVSVIDTGTRRVTGTIGVGHIPTGIATRAGAVWVACNTSSTVVRIDPATGAVTASTELGLSVEPSGFALA